MKAGGIPTFPVGRPYLLLLVGSSGPFQAAYRPLLIEGDRLVHLPAETAKEDALHGVTLREAIRLIRRVPDPKPEPP